MKTNSKPNAVPSGESACSHGGEQTDQRSNTLIDLAIRDIRDGYGTQAVAKLQELRSAVSRRSQEALLPCPFCGSEDLITHVERKTDYYKAWVQCNECSINGRGGCQSDPRAAIRTCDEAWNTRASATQDNHEPMDR